MNKLALPLLANITKAPMPHLQLYGRDYAAKKRATTEAAFSHLERPGKEGGKEVLYL